MARATETVAVKVRMKEGLRRDVERIAIKADRSTNEMIVRLLEAAVIADKAGIIGTDGMIRTIKAVSAEDYAERILAIWEERVRSGRVHAPAPAEDQVVKAPTDK